MLTLNLGCGREKIIGAVNIDIEPSCEPDIVCNFCQDMLPYAEGEVDRVYLFHTVEHIPKKFHAVLFTEISRVLKIGGELYVSYPEFVVVAKYFIDNYQGRRESWENVIYGRQLYPSDFHCTLMYTPWFLDYLKGFGFTNLRAMPESDFEPYNTKVRAVRCLEKAQTIEECCVNTWKLTNETNPSPSPAAI